MTSTSPPRTCAACGASGSGNYCAGCGAPLGARTCAACRAELSAQARFCHRCGASVAPGAARATRPEKTAWMVAGGLVLFLVAMVAWRVLTGNTANAGQRVPDMANAGNAAPGGAGPGDPGGGLPTGPAPDISQMSPQERFLRLNNRIMEAAARGDTATVVNFTPMALSAYAQLPSATNDERYHAAVLNAQVGRMNEALALADTMLQTSPRYLLAYVVRGDIAEIQRDAARLRAAFSDFQAAYDAEIGASRAEYADHRNILDDFLQRARSAS
ncbi:MAG TPA: zinc ribbon domain-containing protein [Gemmatimonadales bacterium]|nr:zinc ribbon domain-containing protein [Gemmatimonadales bacterium]